MSSGIFGWDLLYSALKNDIQNNQDILVCFTHLVLVSNGFKCIGLGESKNIDGTESKSETLPKGWNDDYSIRYVYQGRLYNLKATSLDDAVMINLVRVDERTVGLVHLNVRAVAQKTGTLDEMIPDNKSILEQIKTQLIDKVVLSEKQKDTSSQTETQQPQQGTSRNRSTEPEGLSQPIAQYIQPPLADPFDYGRSDLNPFGINPLGIAPPRPLGGGGMLFQPPRPSFPMGGNLGVPPGSLPPGARFDPFRPPESFPQPRRPPNRPDNDEFPPPGYDDMFM
ncbi:proteasome inhibitor PI31 subunit-like [Cylas formicarius]|uniref:proteasome inhibitor PI31 subunit-like n=1 Tax=Cylas formicarius TaxID=197179 RepID=UPI002958AC2E|nr:proteasome inhibitor PI31 subunit-like [Cylas formicarius]